MNGQAIVAGLNLAFHVESVRCEASDIARGICVFFTREYQR